MGRAVQLVKPSIKTFLSSTRDGEVTMGMDFVCDEIFLDSEDGLQYYSAIENQIDLIITRNKKDFKHSKIPVLTAKKFLSKK